MKLQQILVRVEVALLFVGAAVAAEKNLPWPQFRGPNGTGISDTTGLPLEFGPQKNVVWKTALPAGHSSPVLAADRIFLTAFEGNKLLTLCVDLKTGRLLWQREIERKRTDRIGKPNNPASPSPVTDGENVYVFFQDFGLASYSKEGKERWRMPLGPFNSFFGMAASPILVGDTLVLPCDQDTHSFMVAVHKDTGKLRWRIDRPEVVSGYSTPVQYKPKEGPAQIIVPESFQLTSYSVEDGKKVWWVRGLACEMKSIPSLGSDTLYINGWGFPQNQPGQQIKVPPFADALATLDTDKDGRVAKSEATDRLLKSSFEVFDSDRDGFLDAKEWKLYQAMLAAENGLLSIRVGGSGDMTQQSILWKYQKPVPQVPSTLLYKGVLYMVNDSGILLSFDPATGEVLKQGRLKGAIDKYFASPVAADGKVFLISQAGNVSVVQAAPQWEILAVNDLDDEVYATPAIADGRIYIRTVGALYCFENKTTRFH